MDKQVITIKDDEATISFQHKYAFASFATFTYPTPVIQDLVNAFNKNCITNMIETYVNGILCKEVIYDDQN